MHARVPLDLHVHVEEAPVDVLGGALLEVARDLPEGRPLATAGGAEGLAHHLAVCADEDVCAGRLELLVDDLAQLLRGLGAGYAAVAAKEARVFRHRLEETGADEAPSPDPAGAVGE